MRALGDHWQICSAKCRRGRPMTMIKSTKWYLSVVTIKRAGKSDREVLAEREGRGMKRKRPPQPNGAAEEESEREGGEK
ncbi:Hypothetical protein NTJ_03105 [Nesidiocoris tenuis]|uniref:Uncharacterized protein n=1 Tax=Nesidiocoris tenuis TaxID=355587 RepID=A0ABN7ADC3_9HEMI|nr:Hypothetical protein NTJ_03105 [Nesidiocoris tenuis]